MLCFTSGAGVWLYSALLVRGLWDTASPVLVIGRFWYNALG